MYLNSKVFAQSSLLQHQGNGKFYADSPSAIIFPQIEGCRGCRPVLHYQRSVTSIMEYFVKQILFNN